MPRTRSTDLLLSLKRHNGVLNHAPDPSMQIYYTGIDTNVLATSRSAQRRRQHTYSYYNSPRTTDATAPHVRRRPSHGNLLQQSNDQFYYTDHVKHSLCRVIWSQSQYRRSLPMVHLCSFTIHCYSINHRELLLHICIINTVLSVSWSFYRYLTYNMQISMRYCSTATDAQSNDAGRSDIDTVCLVHKDQRKALSRQLLLFMEANSDHCAYTNHSSNDQIP